MQIIIFLEKGDRRFVYKNIASEAKYIVGGMCHEKIS